MNRAEACFQWLDATTDAFFASETGRRFKDHCVNWQVHHTGGGCLAVEWSDAGWQFLVTDADTNLPVIGAPVVVGFYRRTDDDSSDPCEGMGEYGSLDEVFAFVDAFLARETSGSRLPMVEWMAANPDRPDAERAAIGAMTLSAID